jgi:hypothetical protein
MSKFRDLEDIIGDIRTSKNRLVVVNSEGTGLVFKNLRDLSTPNPYSKDRIDPTYIADDDVKNIKDQNVRDAVYRVTENLKRILTVYDGLLFGSGQGGIVGPAGPAGPQGAVGPAGTTPDVSNFQSFLREFTCDNAVQIGSMVYLAGDNYVAQATTNNTASPSIGIVKSRPTTASALVFTLGFYPIALPRGNIWIGANGSLSDVPPTSGYIQRMGYSVGDGTCFIQPVFDRWLKV